MFKRVKINSRINYVTYQSNNAFEVIKIIKFLIKKNENSL